MSFPCNVPHCEYEFNTLPEQIAHMKGTIHGPVGIPQVKPDGTVRNNEPEPPPNAPPQTIEQKPSSPSTPPPSLKESQTIELTYRFVGKCFLCRRDVDTIELEVDDRSVLVAYCATCKRKITQQPVIPLKNQEELLQKK